MDYILNVYAGGKFVCALGGNNMNYDNVVWWQLSCLINEYKGRSVSKEELKNTINTVSSYFYVLDEEFEGEPSIDLVNETIEKPVPAMYRFDEINIDECGFELVNVNGEYYSKYGEDQYLIPHVEFDEELLVKKVVSFEEFTIINKFVETAIDSYGREFILNKDKILILYSI